MTTLRILLPPLVALSLVAMVAAVAWLAVDPIGGADVLRAAWKGLR